MAKKKAKSKSKKKAATKASKTKSKATKKKAARKPAKKKARRTVMYSSAGKKLYAKRDASGKFKDIQQYSRAHGMDIKRDSAAEAPSAQSTPPQQP